MKRAVQAVICGWIVILICVLWYRDRHSAQAPSASQEAGAGNAGRLPGAPPLVEPRQTSGLRSLLATLPIEQDSVAVNDTSEAPVILRIRVFDEALRPQPGAFVYVETTNSRGAVLVKCDELGLVVLSDLNIGRVSIRGLASGQVTSELRAGFNSVDLLLENVQDLHVIVVDADGLSVPGACVRIADARIGSISGLAGVTDTHGRFVATGVDTKRSVFVSKAGYEPSAAIPLLPAFLEKPRTLHVVLKNGGCRFTIRVTAAQDGMPIAGAVIRVFSLRAQRTPASPWQESVGLGSAPPIIAQASDNGECVFTDAPSPPLRIEAEANGYASCALTVQESSEFGSSVVDFNLKPGFEVSGTAVDEFGGAVADAVVVLVGDHSSDTAQIATDSTTQDGRFYFRGLEPGAYAIKATASQGRRAAHHFEVPLEQSLLIKLSSKPLESGRLADAENVPLSNWYVGWTAQEINPEHGSFPALLTGSAADGRFWLPAECGPDGWLYAWPRGRASMPVLVARRSGEAPVELRATSDVRHLCTMVIRSNGFNPSQPLYARVTHALSGIGTFVAVDQRDGVALRDLVCGAYQVAFMCGEASWRDGGIVELVPGQSLELTVPTNTGYDALLPIK